MKCTLMQIPVNAAENIHCCKTLPWGRINCRFSHSVRDWNIYREILVQKKYDPNKHCTVLLDLCSVSQILTVIPVIFFPPAFQHPIYRQGSKFFFLICLCLLNMGDFATLQTYDILPVGTLLSDYHHKHK